MVPVVKFLLKQSKIAHDMKNAFFSLFYLVSRSISQVLFTECGLTVSEWAVGTSVRIYICGEQFRGMTSCHDDTSSCHVMQSAVMGCHVTGGSSGDFGDLGNCPFCPPMKYLQGKLEIIQIQIIKAPLNTFSKSPLKVYLLYWKV